MINTHEFRDAMSLLTGAVNIITTTGEEGDYGLTASAVCSVTDDPPTLLVCINRSSAAHSHFNKNSHLCVNVLSADCESISKAFSNKSLSIYERFSEGNWYHLSSKAPALKEALVTFDCEIVAKHDVGTHTIFYAEVIATAIAKESPEALKGLIYFNRRYHQVEHARESA